MPRTSILIVSLLACINLVGCSKGPSTNDASILAFHYLSGIIPGITEKEISILGSLEMGGNTIVMVQAGGMMCDMPVIKMKGEWTVGTMSCFGQFEPPEKAAVRLQNTFRARFKTKVVDINNNLFKFFYNNSVMYNKHELDTDTAVYHVTLPDTKAMDCTNEHITSKLKALVRSLCSDYDTHKKYVYYNVSYDYDYYDRNGDLHSKHIVNEDICSNKLLCQ